MNVAIVGSRSFEDFETLDNFVKSVVFPKDIEAVVSGGARGADTLAEMFAARYSISTKILLPDWSKYGRRAGFIRNKLIVDHVDILIAFWNGKSKGTASTIDLARQQNKPTYIYTFEEEDKP